MDRCLSCESDYIDKFHPIQRPIVSRHLSEQARNGNPFECKGWHEEDREDDGGQDHVGLNPTGNPRRSSARTRRKKDRRLFGGTLWSRKR